MNRLARLSVVVYRTTGPIEMSLTGLNDLPIPGLISHCRCLTP
jgi:hypothetical protein